MLLEFSDDPACEALDRQYMLGPSLLVAPVFSEDGDVSFYLPDGKWTHALTGEIVEGGRWRREKHDFMSLPLYARPNSLISLGAAATTGRTTISSMGRSSRPMAWMTAPRQALRSRTPIGEEVFRLTVRRDGAAVHVTASSADVAWTLRLPKGIAVSQAQGATLIVEAGEIATVQGRGSIHDWRVGAAGLAFSL